MIVDFTVSNFRSLRDDQTLSLYVEKKSDHLANNVRYPINKIGVLAVAAIYGPNASGKSNILTALKALFWLVTESNSFKDSQSIRYEPYRLNTLSRSSPISFELEFIVNGNRYLYSIKYDSFEIIYERLDLYSVGKKRTVLSKLFERKKGDNWDDISFGTYFRGGARKIPFFKNQAFLSKAGNTPDAPPFIREIYQFFYKNIYFINSDISQIDSSWKKDAALVNQMSLFLNALDQDIINIHIKSREINKKTLLFQDSMPDHITKEIIDDLSNIPFFEHPCEDTGTQLFEERIESGGIRSLVKSLPVIIYVIKNGSILIWDELETSLHPNVAELVVELFNNREINKHNAQLIFTTHNIALMDSEKMRKDQLWLVEKSNGSSRLISLDEFDSSQLKNNSPFAKWYYDGRLGGLPSINMKNIYNLFSDNDGA